MKIKAYAKINLVLNIVDKRSDGYHNVDMIMQTVGLCDIIKVERMFNSIELSGTGPLNYDETNLAYKAAKLFFDVTGIQAGAKIHIQKNIPMCAGMAGGSTDAAAVLSLLNLLYGKPLSKKVLAKISSKLGADVPFCILGGTARATGIGEIITPITPLGKKTVVIAKPPISISTPWAYSSLNYSSLKHPDTESAVRAIEKGDTEALYELMGNSFEESVFMKYPQIKKIKEKMLSFGARASLMSGSGSAVFGIFEDNDYAKKAYDEFKAQYHEVYITHTV